MPVGVGRIQEIESDYRHANGIGAVVPSIAGFSDVLAGIQSSASSIIAVAGRHAGTLREISTLAQEHIVHTFPHASYTSR